MTDGSSVSRTNNKQNEVTAVGSNTLTFDANGKGSQTLALRRKGNCYRVFAQDDNGSELHAPGAVLHVDGRTRKASFFGTCIGHHHSLVYSTAPGMVRSNALA